MIVRIIENWQGDTLDVYVMPPSAMREAAHVPGQMYRPDPEDGMRLKLVDIPESDIETSWSGITAPAPTFRIPVPVVQDLIDAYLKKHPAANRDDAVQDARATRDRLLSIVEGAMTSYTTSP